jgi:hypothetical protein
MLINYIKEQQKDIAEDDKYEKEIQQLIEKSKEKASKFTIEV